jgi:hypothetical protein
MLTYDKQDEKHMSYELEELMPLFEVKKLLNVSWYRMMEIVRNGDLPVYNISAERIRPEDIRHETRGLRALPSDVKDYIQTLKV